MSSSLDRSGAEYLLGATHNGSSVIAGMSDSSSEHRVVILIQVTKSPHDVALRDHDLARQVGRELLHASRRRGPGERTGASARMCLSLEAGSAFPGPGSPRSREEYHALARRCASRSSPRARRTPSKAASAGRASPRSGSRSTGTCRFVHPRAHVIAPGKQALGQLGRNALRVFVHVTLRARTWFRRSAPACVRRDARRRRPHPGGCESGRARRRSRRGERAARPRCCGCRHRAP